MAKGFLRPEISPVKRKERISWDVRAWKSLNFMGFSLS